MIMNTYYITSSLIFWYLTSVLFLMLIIFCVIILALSCLYLYSSGNRRKEETGM